MSDAFDADALIAAAAPAVGLTIAPHQREAVARFLRIAHGMAQRVVAAPIPDDAFEQAGVFRPGDADV